MFWAGEQDDKEQGLHLSAPRTVKILPPSASQTEFSLANSNQKQKDHSQHLLQTLRIELRTFCVLDRNHNR